MKWVVKAALQNVLAVAPGGRKVNNVLQRKVTHTLPGDDNHFRLKARKAFWHFQTVNRRLQNVPRPLRFFEFGAGWDLIGPLINYALGVDHQVVIDVAQLIDFDLVSNSIRQYARLSSELEVVWGRGLRSLGDPLVIGLADLKNRFGIEYVAPRDARATGLAPGSMDVVTSTGVLQHVPEQDIGPILRECYRLLREGGVISCHVDMFDGFAQFDERLSPYNFLKYSDRTWSLINSPLYFHNRLRARDYINLFRGVGFTIFEEDLRQPRPEDLRALRSLPLATRWQTYSVEDLAIQQISLAAVK